MKNNTRNSKKKLIILGACFILLLGVVFYFYQSRQLASNTAPTSGNQPGVEKTDLNPPTEEEEKAVEQRKEELSKSVTNPQTAQQPTTAARITIVDAAQYGKNVEVRTDIQGVNETSGNCIITFTSGSQQLQKKTPVIQDTNALRCINPSVASSEFPSKGKWTVTAKYESAAHNLTSASREVEVE